MPRLRFFPIAAIAVALATPAHGGQQLFPETLRPPPPALALPTQTSPPAQSVYYFCPATNAYYPYVTSCAVVWRVVPTTPPDAEYRVTDEREHAPLKPTLPPATEAFLRSLVGPPQREPRALAEFRNSSGQACRELERVIVIDGVQQPAIAVVCQRADGRWVISPERPEEATN